MAKFTAVIERNVTTGMFVGYVPGFPGARSEANTPEQLHRNLHEIIAKLLQDGPPAIEGEFIGTQTITVE